MTEMITAKHADLIGIGRPSVIYPNYPKLILRPTSTVAVADNIFHPEPPNAGWVRALNTALMGAGINTAWHCALMWRISVGKWAGLKSRSDEQDTPLTISEVEATPLSREELPRIGAFRSIVEMWRV